MQVSLPAVTLTRSAAHIPEPLGLRVAVTPDVPMPEGEADLVFAALDLPCERDVRGSAAWLLVLPRGDTLRQVLGLAGVAHAAVYLPPAIQLGLAWWAHAPLGAARVEAGEGSRLDGLMSGWLLALRRLPNSVPRPRQGDPHSELLNRARAAVHASLTEGGGLETIAADAGLSRGQLNRVLRRGCGLSPGRYRNELRLRRAALRILVDGLRCAEAAEEVGYRSASQFSAEFSRLYGVRPSRLVGLVETLLARRSEAA